MDRTRSGSGRHGSRADATGGRHSHTQRGGANRDAEPCEGWSKASGTSQRTGEPRPRDGATQQERTAERQWQLAAPKQAGGHADSPPCSVLQLPVPAAGVSSIGGSVYQRAGDIKGGGSGGRSGRSVRRARARACIRQPVSSVPRPPPAKPPRGRCSAPRRALAKDKSRPGVHPAVRVMRAMLPRTRAKVAVAAGARLPRMPTAAMGARTNLRRSVVAGATGEEGAGNAHTHDGTSSLRCAAPSRGRLQPTPGSPGAAQPAAEAQPHKSHSEARRAAARSSRAAATARPPRTVLEQSHETREPSKASKATGRRPGVLKQQSARGAVSVTTPSCAGSGCVRSGQARACARAQASVGRCRAEPQNGRGASPGAWRGDARRDASMVVHSLPPGNDGASQQVRACACVCACRLTGIGTASTTTSTYEAAGTCLVPGTRAGQGRAWVREQKGTLGLAA